LIIIFYVKSGDEPKDSFPFHFLTYVVTAYYILSFLITLSANVLLAIAVIIMCVKKKWSQKATVLKTTFYNLNNFMFIFLTNIVILINENNYNIAKIFSSTIIPLLNCIIWFATGPFIFRNTSESYEETQSLIENDVESINNIESVKVDKNEDE